MPEIFVCYRRSDAPQACRIHDWLVERLGGDGVFIDFRAIPVAESFPEFLRNAVSTSKVLLALIGERWCEKINEPNDWVRMEIQTALESRVTVIPVLIGNTAMPSPDSVPGTISSITTRNALTVGVLADFHTHMRMLLTEIESILGARFVQSAVTSHPAVIRRACDGLMGFLRQQCIQDMVLNIGVGWEVNNFVRPPNITGVILYLHRIRRLAETIELHCLLVFWLEHYSAQQDLVAWVIGTLERTPLIPDRFLDWGVSQPQIQLKVRSSDEDPRQIWRMITGDPMQLSLSYVATISPKPAPKAAPQSSADGLA